MSVNDRQLRAVVRRLKKYAEKDIPAARATAVRKTLNLSRTQVVRKVAEKVQLPAKPVRKRVVIPKSRKGQNPVISMYRHDIPLIATKPRQTRRGVSAGRRRLPGAFIATVRKTNKPHVFKRQGQERYPLEMQRVVIRQAVNRYLPVITRRVFRQRYQGLYQHEINRRAQRG